MVAQTSQIDQITAGNFALRDQYILSGNDADYPPGAPKEPVKMHLGKNPRNYVSLPNLINDLRGQLLEPESRVETSGAPIHALHGMPGVGKTVLAWALCDDFEIQANFPDGILWVTLGQTEKEPAALVPLLREWLENLGERITVTAPSLDFLKSELERALYTKDWDGTEKIKRCILVLDDVWHLKDAKPFLASAKNCLYLLTVRDRALAEELGASSRHIHHISVMEQEDAIRLLEDWSDGVLTKQDRSLKEKAVVELGGLPLAIKIAGSQLKTQPIDLWLESFGAKRLKTRRSPEPKDNLWETLSLSLDALDASVRQLYLALAVFPKDEPTPVQGISRLQTALGALGEIDTRELLNDLQDRALIDLHQNDSGSTVVLHSLLRRLIEEELGAEEVLKTHSALLEEYRKAQMGDGWHTAKNDGYLYNHLAYHLDQLFEEDVTAANELVHLFTDDSWMHTRVAEDDYRHDGFLSDLDRSWLRVQRQLIAQTDARNGDGPLASTIRYALIRTSIQSLSNNYEPGLVGRAVETGLWSIAHAQSIASRIFDPRQRSLMLTAIANSGRCSDIQSKRLTDLAFDSMREIQPSPTKQDVFNKLSPHLTPEQIEQAIQESPYLELIDMSIEDSPIRFSDEAPLEERVNAVLEIEDVWNRSRALAELAPHLEGEVLQKCLDTFLVIHDEDSQAYLLALLSQNLNGTRQKRVVAASLDAALEPGEKTTRVRTLISIAETLQGKARKKALQEGFDTAAAISSEWDRASALAELAPYSRHTMKNALAAALKIQDDMARLHVLSALAAAAQSFLDEPDLSSRASDGFLSRITSICIGVWQKQELRRIQERVIRDGLTTVARINDRGSSVRALASFVPYLQGTEKDYITQTALKSTVKIQDEGLRSSVLALLAAVLEKDDLETGLSAVFAIEDDGAKSSALVAFAPFLHDELMQGYLEQARALEDEWSRLNAMVAIVPALQGNVRNEVLHAVLSEVSEIESDVEKARILSNLAGFLSEEMVDMGLKIAADIEDERTRADALVALALAEQTDKNQQKILNLLSVINDRTARFQAYLALLSKVNANAHLQELRVQFTSDLYNAFRSSSRKDLLRYLAHPSLLAPPLFSIDAIGDVADSVIDVTTKWRWQ